MLTWKDHINFANVMAEKMGARNSYKDKIRDVLAESTMPMDVENVRQRSGLKNWESTKAILLEMVLLGAIAGQQTTKGWIFWVKPNPKRTKRN
jgi:hypothetical protein